MTVNRPAGLRKLGPILIAAQLVSGFAAVGEMFYDNPPTPVVVLASCAIAAAWLALAAWSGWRGKKTFPRFALIVWLIIVAIMLLTMLLTAVGSETRTAGVQFALPLFIVAASPLHGLSPLIPLQGQTLRYLVTALLILALCLVAYFVGRRVAPPDLG